MERISVFDIKTLKCQGSYTFRNILLILLFIIVIFRDKKKEKRKEKATHTILTTYDILDKTCINIVIHNVLSTTATELNSIINILQRTKI